MALKMILADAKIWKNIIESLTLLDEANFIASERGIELRAMDPSRVAMVDFFLPASAFEEYECSEVTRLGINLDEMTQIMRRAGTSDTLQMELEGTAKLVMTFEGQNVRSFGISLLDLGESEYPAPTIDSKVKIKLTADALQQAVKDAEIIGDHIRIVAEDHGITLSASSETKDVKVIIEKDSDVIAEFNVREESSAMYSLSYLSEMTKAIKASELVMIAFSASMPIQLEFPIVAGGKLTYYLAPRIET
ncbi:MAG: proliferating cell nuclear antigen (pcna), partial [Candidatus Heimdallarchaeota archaeon]|nr:proliferating cell nuclear antigen (pcna) [Candidatus Heimdallarchaeota archaeon]